MRALIDKAAAAGVKLWIEGEVLRYHGPAKAVEALLPELKQHKAELLKDLAHPRCCGCASLRMAEIPWDRQPYHRFVWMCAKGHLAPTHGTPELRHLSAPDSCLAAGDFVPAFTNDRKAAA